MMGKLARRFLQMKNPRKKTELAFWLLLVTVAIMTIAAVKITYGF